MADQYQFPVFYTISGYRLRLVLIGEQEVNGRWVVEHGTTELAQFSPLDGDVYRIVERVREQYTNLTSRPRTSVRMSTATRPRRRPPPSPRPRSPPPSPPRRPYSPIYSLSTPERCPPPTAPPVEQEFVTIKFPPSPRAPTPPPHFGLELEPAPLVDIPMDEYPRTQSPEIPTSPRASPSQVVPGTPPTQPRRWRPPTPARRPHPRARQAIDLAGVSDAIARARTTPARPEHAPLATHPPPGHPRTIRPRWARRARHLWSECHICLEQRAHSALECCRCGQQPVCCECVSTLESSSLNCGRCPVCRHTGEAEPWY
jgi:hypothetical protein